MFSIHILTLAVTAIPAALAQNFYGCYTEGAGVRALTGNSTNDPAMTLSMYGVEYSTECYCGNSLNAGSFPFFPGDCSMSCGGAPGETCGGPDRLSLYGTSSTLPTVTANPLPNNAVVTTFQELGCFVETTTGRALSGRSTTSSSSMTVEGCGDFCRMSGFLFFGVEYSSQCYCDNSNGSPGLASSPTACSDACAGNANQVCGGSGVLNVYEWS